MKNIATSGAILSPVRTMVICITSIQFFWVWIWNIDMKACLRKKEQEKIEKKNVKC